MAYAAACRSRLVLDSARWARERAQAPAMKIGGAAPTTCGASARGYSASAASAPNSRYHGSAPRRRACVEQQRHRAGDGRQGGQVQVQRAQLVGQQARPRSQLGLDRPGLGGRHQWQSRVLQGQQDGGGQDQPASTTCGRAGEKDESGQQPDGDAQQRRHAERWRREARDQRRLVDRAEEE